MLNDSSRPADACPPPLVDVTILTLEEVSRLSSPVLVACLERVEQEAEEGALRPAALFDSAI